MRTVALAVCASALASIGLAHAHGGLSMDEDYCKLRVGKYFIHFTGYQPESTTTKEFCEDIPATGRTIVVLDYVSDELRDLPIEVRIVRDSGNPASEQDAAKLNENTVLHVPAKVYPTGTLHFEHNFSTPGKFVGLVSVKNAQQQSLVSRFPFSVGSAGGGVPMLWPGIAAIAGGVALYFFARNKRDQALGA